MTSRAEDLRADYDLLGEKLTIADPSAVASIARERRIIGELLDALEIPQEVSVVDQLAARRNTGTDATRPASRRRKPG